MILSILIHARSTASLNEGPHLGFSLPKSDFIIVWLSIDDADVDRQFTQENSSIVRISTQYRAEYQDASHL